MFDQQFDHLLIPSWLLLQTRAKGIYDQLALYIYNMYNANFYIYTFCCCWCMIWISDKMTLNQNIYKNLINDVVFDWVTTSNPCENACCSSESYYGNVSSMKGTAQLLPAFDTLCSDWLFLNWNHIKKNRVKITCNKKKKNWLKKIICFCFFVLFFIVAFAGFVAH